MICETDGRPVNGQGGAGRHYRRREPLCETCRLERNRQVRRIGRAKRADPAYRDSENARHRRRYATDPDFRRRQRRSALDRRRRLRDARAEDAP